MDSSIYVYGLVILGNICKEKYPPALERALLALWKEASECTFSTILEALYLMIASGLVAM